MNTRNQIILACFVASALACSGGGDGASDDAAVPDASASTPTGPDDPSGPGTVGSSGDTTFDHPDSATNLFDLIDRLQQEGPAHYSSRVHGCRKLRYTSLGRVLESLGVDLDASSATSAGHMWRESARALGAPDYRQRTRESHELMTASAARMFDIFVQAAPEIIAAMPAIDRCTVSGQGTAMFDGNGSCTSDGISCLIGVPATLDHISQCNFMIGQASTPTKGRHIAVAALLAAAYTCE